MKNILKFEIHKLFRQRSFYICLAITAAIGLLGAVSTNAIFKLAGGDGYPSTGWQYAVYSLSNSNVMMILSIFIALFVCEDIDSGTLKNIISRGYDRNMIYVGKYFSSLIAAFIFYVVNIIAGFLIATAFWEAGSSEGCFRSLAAQAVVLMASHALYYAVAVIIGKTGGAVAVGIIAPNVISLVLTVADNLLHLEDFSFSDHWLTAFLETAQDITASGSDIAAALVISLVYAAVFFIIGAQFNKNRQL